MKLLIAPMGSNSELWELCKEKYETLWLKGGKPLQFGAQIEHKILSSISVLNFGRILL